MKETRKRRTRSSKTLLVVEDDADARKILATVLGRAGYAVLTAKNGIEALAKLEAVVPSAILLDLRMPGLDGWGFERMVRENPRLAHVPVVIVSALAELESARMGLNAALYFQKPIDLEELLHSLPTVIGSGRRKRGTSRSGMVRTRRSAG